MVTKTLHRNPVLSTAVLLVIGMALIFANMVFLSKKTNEEMAEQYAENYIQSLNEFQSQYSSKVVGRLRDRGVEVSSTYLKHEGAIPVPATLGIELAESLTNPQAGITTRLYSDFPFANRKDGGPRDEFESLALTKLRFAEDKKKPFVRYERVNGRESLRYAKAMIMEKSCVDCHNSHPDSPKKDWKIGDVRGARAVAFPLDVASGIARKGWAVTLVVMLGMTISGLGIIYLVVRALRNSIDLLSKTNAAFNRFVPHEFLQYLNKENIVEVELSDSVETQMTVLFSDIRSFTDLSEGMTPEENFKFVNDYLQVMGPVVRRNHGFIDKYIGDAIMALFDNTEHAIAASLEMLKVLESFNAEHLKKYPKPIQIGIGLHRGKVRLGTVGESGRMDGTVISDTVNLASRVEGLTKFYGVQFLVTASVLRGVNEPERLQIRFIDKVKVKGKTEPVLLYEVFSADPEPLQAKKLSIRNVFEEGTRLFAVKEFAKARVQFERVLAQFPEDKAAKSYLARCDQYANQELSADWDGSLALDSK